MYLSSVEDYLKISMYLWSHNWLGRKNMGDKIIICNKEFVLDEIGYYIGKMNVWEKETDIFLEIKANEKDVDDIVFEKINWLNKNKSKIIDTFMEENDYSGLENITGIPGSVGGLVNMNGGAYGTEIFDCIEEVEVCKNDGEIVTLKTSDLKFEYRTTEIKINHWIVVSALFKFGRGFDKAASQDKRDQRAFKHPLDLPNLGSTFKNPEGTFAAKLISDAGLKGYRVGDAMVSPKHPNFVTNLGNAKFSDVIGVIQHVKEVVLEKFGIQLETEIIILEK